MHKVATHSSRKQLLLLVAVGTGVVGVLLAVSAIIWADAASANVLAEFAGVSVSVAVALAVVDRLTTHVRSVRYAELTWVVSETALDLAEEVAGRIAFASRAVVPQSSVEIYLRPEDPGDEPDDRQASFWRSRKPEEAEYHVDRMKKTQGRCAAHAQDAVPPSETTVRTLSSVGSMLERLEGAGDRLSATGTDAEEVLVFVRWLWRAGDQRHGLTDALAAVAERQDHREVWHVVDQLVYYLQGAYETGLPVAESAMRARPPRRSAEPHRARSPR